VLFLDPWWSAVGNLSFRIQVTIKLFGLDEDIDQILVCNLVIITGGPTRLAAAYGASEGLYALMPCSTGEQTSSGLNTLKTK